MIESTVDTNDVGGITIAVSKRLVSAISQAEVAVLLTDALGKITYLNPYFTQLTGHTLDHCLGKSIGLFKSDVHDSNFYTDVQEQLRGAKSWAGRITLRGHGESPVETRSLLQSLQDDAGLTVGYVAFCRDSNDESKLESQLLQAHKMEAIGELAAGIAHEINTPIQYVGDNIQFLRDALGDIVRLIDAYARMCDKARTAPVENVELDRLKALREEIDWDYLHEEIPLAIEQSLEGRNRVAEIVRAMKEFAHPGDETLTPVDLKHAIESTLAVSCNEWKYVADVKIQIDDDVPAITCYPASFNQVLLNLVVNAAHAIASAREGGGREKGIISIRASIVGQRVELCVQDTGCGIPASHRERIFEPFFTTKEIGKGTGQGLPLVHLVVVERLGGTIEVDSIVGVGTTFRLRLPLHAGEYDTEDST